MEHKVEITQKCNWNSTSRLWLQRDSGTIYKEYVISNFTSLRNKINLILLSRRKELYSIPEIVMPQQIIRKNINICGYIMPYIEGWSLGDYLRDGAVSANLKLDALCKLADVIQKLPVGVFIGDLHADNVVVTKGGEIKIIDIDGFSLRSGFKISCPIGCYLHFNCIGKLSKYRKATGRMRISRDSDILCFFIIFLQWLMGNYSLLMLSESEWFRYFDYLKEIGFPDSILEMLAVLFSKKSNYLDASRLREIQPSMIEKYTYSRCVEFQNYHCT